MMEAAVMKLHSQEYARAATMSSDLELAFELQLSEALSASVRDIPGVSSSSRTEGTKAAVSSQGQATSPKNQEIAGHGGDTALAFSMQSSEFSRQEQNLIDQGNARIARRKLREELCQRSHDRAFAKSIMEIDEEQWEAQGDLVENPFTRVVTSTNREVEVEDELHDIDPDDDQMYNLFFTMVREDSGYVGIAWAVTDKSGFVLFQQSNCLGLGVNSSAAHFSALISGLEYAYSAGVRNIIAYGTSTVVSNQVSGVWSPSSRSILNFIDKVWLVGEKLSSFRVRVASQPKMIYATNLAKRAVASHFEKLAKDRKASEAREECPICCEKVPTVDMFAPKTCSHRICRDCLSHYVEVQIKANQVPVRCPQECVNLLDLDQCRPYLSLKVMESFEKSLAEASIPESQRVYCPFPNCSALMSKDGLTLSAVGSTSRRPTPSSMGCCECMECHRLFCVECHVPWHTGMTCADYQKLPEEERDAEDAELYRLAKHKKWQRCKKCQSVIELDKGCYHMTCRCGYEFCYSCGAEWKDKEPTCKCKLWDENNIISDDEDNDDDADSEDSYDSEFDLFEDHPPPPGQPYKTKICRFWRNGFCREGEFCTFAHGEHELRYFPFPL